MAKLREITKKPFYKKPVFQITSILFAVLLILIGFLGFLSYGVYKDALTVKASLDALEVAAKSQDLNKLKAEITNTRSSFATFKNSYSKIAWMSAVPFVGAYVADGQHAIAAAEHGFDAGDIMIKVIVCITEGIPVKDMMTAKQYVKDHHARLVGPNCPGMITPGEAKVGIMPGFVFKKGTIGIVSKSGTLTYEAADQIVKAGLGITTAIGIGGDPIIGTPTKDAVELLMNDPETEGIVMIGEIGGNYEPVAARWIKENGNKKPVVGFIAGQTAPPGRRMGHAGAIIGGAEDTATAKMKIMRECGIHVVESPALIGETMAKIIKKK
jgi:succinyl-CoA synthetase alpha subunit